MAKISNKKEIHTASEQMLLEIKKDLPINLEEVLAQRKGNSEDRPIILKYHEQDLEKYEDKFINKYLKELNDEFVFEEYSRIWTCDSEGHHYKTNFFCPRSFWDRIFKEVSNLK